MNLILQYKINSFTGRILCLTYKGAVWSLKPTFEIILMACFCLMISGFRVELFAHPYTLIQYAIFELIIAKYRVLRASVVINFFSLFKQNRDFEIFAQSCVI